MRAADVQDADVLGGLATYLHEKRRPLRPRAQGKCDLAVCRRRETWMTIREDDDHLSHGRHARPHERGAVNVWVVSGCQNTLYEIHTSRIHIFLSSHEDPADPPKMALLEDNSAPSLYPNTYTAI
jgi:hypothetical protein